MEALYVIAGFFVGTVIGLTGVGGGSLMTPLLLLIFGIAPATAVGTDLLFAGLTKAGGAWAHARRGNVAWKVVGRLALGSLPAAAVTLALVHGADRGRLPAIVSVALGIALILTAAALLFRESLHSLAARRGGARAAEGSPRATIALGAILGVLVSTSSVGAGALGATALLLLYPNLTAARIVGSDIAHAVPLTLAAGLGYAWAGAVDWPLLATLLAGSLPGIWLGSALGGALPERLLRNSLAALLLLVGGRLVW